MPCLSAWLVACADASPVAAGDPVQDTPDTDLPQAVEPDLQPVPAAIVRGLGPAMRATLAAVTQVRHSAVAELLDHMRRAQASGCGEVTSYDDGTSTWVGTCDGAVFLDVDLSWNDRDLLALNDATRPWSDLGGLPPAFHGAPTRGLTDLGQRIADDESYARCFIKRSWEGLLRRPLTAAETPVINEVLAPFEESGLHIRDAWLAIVRSALWRAVDAGPKVASPALLSSEIEDLTGFRWTDGGWDLIRAPLTGYAPLAGGVDGDLRFAAYTQPTSSLVLVQSQLALQAAASVAASDLADPVHARLLTRVTADEARDEVVRAQLVDLHARITGERVAADDPRVDAEVDLWIDTRAETGEAAKAWATVLTVLLRDPNVVVF
jgi:hypothetical protein